ncbi:SOS response-associated peptidase [Aestuariibaculum sp. TT11]|uniref:Abasic site processing protein n=2 Tax=Aestuariibaculum sediminum TaxID=2770637 RepID=A0A8J6Q6L9_9FLAO|nr:SOS response-associated peptidase [Aestuariibaculum sediminum]
MCYDIKASLESQLKRAKRKGDLQAVEEIIEKLVPLTDLPIYHASGFSHPEMFIYTSENPDFPLVATWGLIPDWVRDEEDVKQIWNKTLNARGETIFEKPAFKNSAEHHRCLIYVDGFYEHHHLGNKTYPYFIYRKDMKPLALAGLYTIMQNKMGGQWHSFTIVTTQANRLLEKIHNNPKLKGPRMPVILEEEKEDLWIDINLDKEKIEQLVQPFPEDKLTSHTVAKLRGKAYVGNTKDVSKLVYYPELDTLF